MCLATLSPISLSLFHPSTVHFSFFLTASDPEEKLKSAYLNMHHIPPHWKTTEKNKNIYLDIFRVKKPEANDDRNKERRKWKRERVKMIRGIGQCRENTIYHPDVSLQRPKHQALGKHLGDTMLLSGQTTARSPMPYLPVCVSVPSKPFCGQVIKACLVGGMTSHWPQKLIFPASKYTAPADEVVITEQACSV